MKHCINLRSGPDGLHVYERRSGINILIDEIDIPPDEWSLAPRQVSIALTNECNLHCPFCYAPKHAAMLDLEQVKKWLSELSMNGCLGVGLGGGEPTLYKELPDLCYFASKHTKLALTITTNAHLLNDSLVENIKGHVAFVRVSMDGVGDTYEKIRGKTFSSLCNQFRKVQSIAAFGINYVINAQTFPGLDKAVTIAADYGAKELLLLPEQPAQGRQGIDANTVSNLTEWVQSYSGPLRLNVSEGGADYLPTCDPLVKEKDLRSYAHIDASGVLKRSSFILSGIKIKTDGLMQALSKLQKLPSEVMYENMA